MKKVLLTMFLGLATLGYAQEAANPAGQQQGAAEQKTIKDPAEYNAYVNALQIADPAAKAQALEQFVQQYPQSVVFTDALEALLGTYQQSNNAQGMAQTAQRILQKTPNHVPALAIQAITSRQAAAQGQNAQQNWQQARAAAERGLQALGSWQRPPTVSEQDFQKQKAGLEAVFNSTIGAASLQQKDYPTAQKHLQNAVQMNPNSLEDVYFLALSYLEAPNAPPEQVVRGLWYIARASNLSPTPQGKDQIAKYGRSHYMRYHGGDDGWQELIAQTAQQPQPPQGFTIKPAPTPAEIAQQVLQNNPVNELAFGDWLFILSNGFPEDKEKVWQHLSTVGLMKLNGTVIESTPERVLVAVTDDAKKKRQADVALDLAKPDKTPPAVGSNIEFTGRAKSYAPDPLLVTFGDGELLGKPAAAPAKKPTPRRQAPR